MLLRLCRNKKAQTTAEYAILFGLVVGALLAMQIYVRRGLQGRVKDVVDHTGAGGEVGAEALVFSGDQYEPYYTSSAANTESASEVRDEARVGGEVVKTIVGQEETRAARQVMTGWQGEAVEEQDLPDDAAFTIGGAGD